MKPSPSRPDDRWRTRVRRFTPVALFAVAPKGVCCLAAYSAGGALFGRELCGASESSALVVLLPWLGGGVGSAAWWLWHARGSPPVNRDG